MKITGRKGASRSAHAIFAPDETSTQWCLKYAGIAQFRYESAGRIRLANAGTERLARGGTHVRQPVGDEPHPAEIAAATGRSVAGQDALRHDANGQSAGAD